MLQAIEELGYEPSEVARSLKTKSTASIGLIISNIELNFFTRVARSVQDAAAALASIVRAKRVSREAIRPNIESIIQQFR